MQNLRWSSRWHAVNCITNRDWLTQNCGTVLGAAAAVLIEGPKACGKTATAREIAAGLLKLKDRVDTAKMGAPSKMLIVTAAGYAYERPDGVAVAPVGALGP